MAAPTLTAISSDNGTFGNDFLTNDTSLTFSGTADASSFVEVFVNGVSVAFGQADGSGNWSIDLASQYGNFAAGTVSLAVPLFSRDGQAGMAVTATMFTGQYEAGRAQDIVGDLKRFAETARRYVVT